MDRCGLCGKHITTGQRSIERPCCQGRLHEECFKAYLSYAQSSHSGKSCPICRKPTEFDSESFQVFDSRAEAYDSQTETPVDVMFQLNGLLANAGSDDDTSQLDSDDEVARARPLVSALQEKVTELTEQLNHEQKAHTADQQEVERLTTLLQETQDRNRHLRDGYEQFQRDAEASINSLKVSQGDELRALQAQLSNVDVRHAMHVTDLRQGYEQALSQHKADLEMAVSESEQLRGQITRLTSEFVNDRELTAKQQQHSQELEQLKAENVSLKHTIDEQETTHAQALAGALAESEKLKNDLTKLFVELESSKDLVTKAIALKQQEIDELLPELLQLRVAQSGLQKLLEEKNIELAKFEEASLHKQNAIDELVSAQQMLREGFESSLKEKDIQISRLSQEVINSERDPEDLNTVVEQKQAEIERLTQTTQKLEEDVANSAAQLKVADNVSQQLQTEIDRLRQESSEQVGDREKELAAGRLLQQSLEQEILQLKEALTQQSFSQPSLASQKATESTHDGARDVANFVSHEPIQTGKAWDDEESFFGGFGDEDEPSSIAKEAEDMSQKPSFCESSVDVESEIAEGHSSNAVEAEPAQLEQEEQRTPRRLQAQLAAQGEYIERLSDQQYDLESQVSLLQEQLADSKLELERVQQALGQKEAEIQALIERLDDSASKALQADFSELREESDRSILATTPKSEGSLEISRVPSLEDQVADLQRRWESQAHQATQREAEFESMVQQNSYLQTELTSLQAGQARLEAEREELRETNYTLQTELIALRTYQEQEADLKQQLGLAQEQARILRTQLEQAGAPTSEQHTEKSVDAMDLPLENEATLNGHVYKTGGNGEVMGNGHFGDSTSNDQTWNTEFEPHAKAFPREVELENGDEVKVHSKKLGLTKPMDDDQFGGQAELAVVSNTSETSLSSRVSELSVELEQTKLKCSEVQSHVDSEVAKNLRLQQEISSLKAENDTLENDIAVQMRDLEMLIDTGKDERDRHETECSNWRSQCDDLRSDNHALEKSLQRQQESQLSELAQRDANIAELTDRIGVLEDQLEQAQSLVTAQTVGEERLNEGEGEAAAAQLAELRAEFESMKSHAADLQSAREVLAVMTSELRQEVSSLQLEKVSLQQDNAALQTQLAAQTNEPDVDTAVLKEKLSKANEGFQKAKLMCAAFKKQCDELKEVNAALEQSLQNQQSGEFLAEKERMSQRILSLEEQLEQVQTQVRATPFTESRELHFEGPHSSEIPQLQAELETLNGQFSTLQTAYDQQQQELESLKSQRDSAQDRLAKATENFQKAKLMCAALKKQCDELKETNSNLERVVQEQQDQQIEELSKRHAIQQADRTQLSERISALEMELQQSQQPSSESLTALQADLASVQLQYADLQRSYDSQLLSASQLQQELDSLKLHQTALQDSNSDLQQEYEAQASQLQQELESIKLQNARLQSEIASQGEADTDLKEKLAKTTENFQKVKLMCAALKKQCEEVKEANAALKETNSNLERTVQEQQDQQIEELSKRHAIQQADRTQLSERIAILEAQLEQSRSLPTPGLSATEEEELRSKLAKAVENFGKAKALCSSLSESKAKLTQEIHQAQEAAANNMAELGAANQSMAQLQAALDSLKAQYEQAQNSIKDQVAKLDVARQAEETLRRDLEKSNEGFTKAKALCANLKKQCKEEAEAKALLMQELHAKSEQWEQVRKTLEQELAASQTSLQHAVSQVTTLEQRLLNDSGTSEKTLAELAAATEEANELRRSVEGKDAALEKYAGEQFALEVELEELRERVKGFGEIAPAPASKPLVFDVVNLKSFLLETSQEAVDLEEVRRVCVEFLGRVPVPQADPQSIARNSSVSPEESVNAISAIDESIQTLCGEQFVLESELEELKEAGGSADAVQSLSASIQDKVEAIQRLVAQRLALSDAAASPPSSNGREEAFLSEMQEKEEELVRLILENVELRRKLETQEAQAPLMKAEQTESSQEQHARFVAELVKAHNEVQKQMEQELHSATASFEERAEEFKRALSVRQEEHSRDLAELEVIRGKLEAMEATGGPLTEACHDYEAKLQASAETLRALKEAYTVLEAECSESEVKRLRTEKLHESAVAEQKTSSRENESLQNLYKEHTQLVALCKQYESKLQEQQVEREKVQAELANERTLSTQQQQQRDVLAERLEAQQREFAEQQQQLEQQRQVIEQQQRQAVEEKEQQQLAQQQSELIEQHRQLEQQRLAMEQQHSAALHEQTAALERQQAALTDLQTSNATLLARCATYEAQMQERQANDNNEELIQSLRETNRQLTERCATMERLLQENEQRVGDYEQRLASQQALMEGHTSELKALQDKLAQTELQNEMHTQQLKQFTEGHQSSTVEGSRLASEIQTLTQKLAEATMHAERWRTAHQELEQSRNLLQKELEGVVTREKQEAPQTREAAPSGHQEENPAIVHFLRNLAQQQAKKLRLLGFDTTSELVADVPPALESWAHQLLKSLPPAAVIPPPPCVPAPAPPRTREGSSYFFMSTITLTFAAVLSAALT